jgi:hypothetical protein
MTVREFVMELAVAIDVQRGLASPIFASMGFLLRYATPPPSNALVKRVMNPPLPVMSRFMILTRSTAWVLSTMGRQVCTDDLYTLGLRHFNKPPEALVRHLRDISAIV